MIPLEELIQNARLLNKEKKYKEVVKLLPESVLKEYKSADLYSEKAKAYWKQEDDEKAKEHYQKAITLDPDDALAYNNLGSVYRDQKEYEKAKECYQKAIALDPDTALAYDNLGAVYSSQQDDKKAIEYFQKAIGIDPTSAFTYSGLGISNYALENYKEAKQYFQKSIELDPAAPLPYTGLGFISYNKKEYEKAIEYFQKTIDLDPEVVLVYNRLADAYFNSKEYRKSLDVYEEIVSRFKDSFYVSVAKSKIEELTKLLKSGKYSEVRKLIDTIKDILLLKDGCVTHYTGLSASQALIIDGSLFRLSEGAFLNDTSEGRELNNFLLVSVATHDHGDTVAKQFAQKPFIGSFVAENKHDDLTLWRMYGKEDKEEAKGCAITIDTEGLIKNVQEALVPDSKADTSIMINDEFSFYRVAYRKESGKDSFIVPGVNAKEVKKLNHCMLELSEQTERFRAEDDFDQQDLEELLNEIAYLFKSAEYQYEQELRLVVSGVGFEKKFSENSYPDPPKVYIELVPIRSLIRKITLGPKVERADEWAAAFHYSLKEDDYEPDILISHLPFK